MAQREIPCPNCSGPGSEKSVVPKTSGRIFSKISGWLQRSFSITLPTDLINYIKERSPTSRSAALNNKCSVCKGKQTIPDPSDDRDRYEASAGIAQGKSQEIINNEALLGTGGNRYTVVAGSDLLEVGLGMNDAPSYRVDPCASVRNWGNAGPGQGEGQVNPSIAGLSVPRGAPANHVQGLNPPSSPGGHYVIKCSNKFTIVTGSQGIDITTGGPITINGGITQITGPEVTVGTSTGRLVLEGETVNLNGKSVEVAPTDGHFYVRGTISNSGNMMVGGHAHIESASVVQLETTGKMETSDTSSSSNIYGGPAFWGGPSLEGIAAALREFASYGVMNASSNPNFLKTLLSTRFWLGFIDEAINLAYSVRPIEIVPTGICLTLGFVPGLVFNFPHIHALPDGMHQHEIRMPNIDYSADSAKELKGKQTGVEGPAPINKKQTSVIDALVSLWEFVSSVFVAVAVPTQHGTYIK